MLMKRLSLQLSITLTTFSISIGIVIFWLLNHPLPTVDFPQNPPECASEFEAEIDSIDSRSNWRKKFLLRFREFPLEESPSNINESYRLTWVPTFHKPTVIRVWRSGENNY